MPDWALFVIGLVLTLGAGFFVANEFSLVNLDRAEVEARRNRGERGLGWTINALKHTSTHLSSAQLGITLTTLVAGFTLQPSLANWLAVPFAGWGLAPGVAAVVAGIVAAVIATVLSMLFGELVPQYLAFSAPLATARVVVPFQTVFTTIL